MPTPPDPQPRTDRTADPASPPARPAAAGRRPRVDPATLAERFPVGSVHLAAVRDLGRHAAICTLRGGVEGRVHVTELTWGRPPRRPAEVLAPGQAVRLKVVAVDPERGRVDLSLRRTLPDPWADLDARLPVGALVSGRVTRIKAYGAFVRVEGLPGAPAGADAVEGLLHRGELSWTRPMHTGKIGAVVRVGEAVTLRVLAVDPAARRLSLGLKQVTVDPWAADIPARYAPGMRLRGRVTRVARFGAFIEVGPGIVGLLHASEMADAGADGPLAAGREVEVEILRVDPAARRIALSTRAPARRADAA